ncbi:L,D-transpeptidase family protein [Paracnuella aquatica]|uniref:L,D-transpeptidase family protein n=1 Tax=Paracnuella aquatica TaxID=2268757 RepID=UPI000DEFD0B8|nr:L,D-transpeptidase family protein [Paracnuella aquatica]
MKLVYLFLFALIAAVTAFGQMPMLASGPNMDGSFISFQRTLPRPGEALKRKEDTLQRQFKTKGLEWPAKYLYIRNFKYDGQLEVWVRNDRKDEFKLFKTYKVCALAGSLGPKRMEGDYQVPEGFYFINEFNPRSTYHLSLGLNYPNASDKLLSDIFRPGGDIYIHGSCVTVGCIPVNNEQIEELYILAAHAKNRGQDFIPVHIFPIRYNNKKSQDYLNTLTKTDAQLKQFAQNLELVYDHFELTRQLPLIMVNNQGDYVFDGLTKKLPPPPPKPKRAPVPHRHRDIVQVADAVHQWPQFPGGNEHFLKYLDKMGDALAASLPDGKKKAYVVVEFIVDSDGTPTNFKMVQGVDEEFNDEVITVLEQMPVWQPAVLNDKPVAKKIRQGFGIEKSK